METKRIHLTLVSITVLWIGGCAMGGGEYGRVAVPAGSALVLHERLPVPAGEARVYVQNGEVVDDVNRFDVACYFGLERQGDEALTDAIRPDRFVVAHGSRSWAQAGVRRGDGALVAAMGGGAFALGPFHSDPGSVQRLIFHTEFPLQSARQPQVESLHCRYNGYPVEDQPPTYEQIQRTLGDLATLTR